MSQIVLARLVWRWFAEPCFHKPCGKYVSSIGQDCIDLVLKVGREGGYYISAMSVTNGFGRLPERAYCAVIVLTKSLTKAL